MSNIAKVLMLLVIGLVIAAVTIYLIGGKKQEFNAELIIKAPVGQIFPYVAKPELKQLWMKGLVEQQLTVGDSVKEGSLLKSTVMSNGMTESFNDEVIRYQENEIVSIKSKNKRLSSTTMMKFKEEGNGTRVTYKRVVKYNGIDRLKTVFAESHFQQELESDLRELNKLIENNLANPSNTSTETTEGTDASTAANESN